jgi:hypothetical protein
MYLVNLANEKQNSSKMLHPSLSSSLNFLLLLEWGETQQQPQVTDERSGAFDGNT